MTLSEKFEYEADYSDFTIKWIAKDAYEEGIIDGRPLGVAEAVLGYMKKLVYLLKKAWIFFVYQISIGSLLKTMQNSSGISRSP